MKDVLRGALVTVASAAAINLALYLCQHLPGWSDALRYGTGALLLLLGAFSVQGDGPKEALLTRRYVRTTSQDDLAEFNEARCEGMSSGWLFIAVGAATLALTLLAP